MTLEFIKDLGIILWPTIIALFSGLFWLFRLEAKTMAVTRKVKHLVREVEQNNTYVTLKLEKYYEQVIDLNKDHHVQSTNIEHMVSEIKEIKNFIKTEGFERLRYGLVEDITSLVLKKQANEGA